MRGACPEKSHHAGLHAHPATSDYTASAATTTPLIPNCSATPNETSAIAATVFISIYQIIQNSIADQPYLLAGCSLLHLKCDLGDQIRRECAATKAELCATL